MSIYLIIRMSIYLPILMPIHLHASMLCLQSYLMMMMSGRVAALMAESETPSTSIYRNNNNNNASTGSAKNDGKAGSYSSSSSGGGGGESFAARDKYAGQKGILHVYMYLYDLIVTESSFIHSCIHLTTGISSDQFFGRDQEDPNEIRSKLDQFSNSTAISSDMMMASKTTKSSRTGEPSSSSNNSSLADANNSNSTFDKLKSSVAGFFDGFN